VMQRTVLLLLLAIGAPALGGPLPSEPFFSIQENFDLNQFMGKWYDVAAASNCPWLKSYKGHITAGTLEVKPGESSDTISMTRTAIRHGTCKQMSMIYKLTETPGRLFYHNDKWAADIDTYVVHTNYDEYAIVAMTKQKKGQNKTTTFKLYDRSAELRPTLMDEFTQLVKEQGMSDDDIVTLKNAGECVPGEPAPEPEIQRTRRNVLLLQDEEGSGSEMPNFLNADSCLSPPDIGHCYGTKKRFYYNSTLMACLEFNYGGCLGNKNNFATEKACLQHCRTEAACRLPMDPGPCKTYEDLWAFDSVIGKCVPFKYGGCQGNGNKFYSQNECEEYCGVAKTDNEELLKVK
uniref:Protein AMBP n=2 Tax=Scleropages formosus TaxID=113540 RepID=A0A8C9QVW6_SCLFO